MFGAEVGPAELCSRAKLATTSTTCFLRLADIMCRKRDLSFILTWTPLSSGRHCGGWGSAQAVSPLVETLAEHTSQTGPGGAWLGPEELLALAHKRWETGSASDDSTPGRFPSEQLPKMPPSHLGKRQRVHRVAGGPSSLGLLQLLSHLWAFGYVVPSACNSGLSHWWAQLFSGFILQGII